MNASSPIETQQTRMVFRVLAAIIAAVLLLVGFPLALSGAFMDTWWESAIWAIISLYAGIGLGLGSRTGRWYRMRA
jgi:hypothetical protein